MNRLLPKATVRALTKQRAVRRRRQEILTSVRISRELHKKIQILAKKIDRPQSWIMREAVTSWVTWKTAQQKVEGGYEAGAVHHNN